MIELVLKPGASNYAGCAGIYTEYKDSYGETQIYSNSTLTRVILFYAGNYQITSWVWYPNFMRGDEMGGGFHASLTPASAIEDTIWLAYDVKVLSIAANILGMGGLAIVCLVSLL